MIIIDSWQPPQQAHAQTVSIATATTVTLKSWLDLICEYAEQAEDNVDAELLTLGHLISNELVRRNASPNDPIPFLDC